MLQKPFFQLLDSSLSEVVPTLPAECRGEWSTNPRRVYASPTQLGSGDGPFADVVDVRWTGTLNASVDLSAIAFLSTAREIYWSKSPVVSPVLPIQISLTAYANYTPSGATFSASIAKAYLPGVPVAVGARLEEVCTLGPRLLTAGRVACLAQTNEAAFLAVLFPRALLKVGRNRLWRIRDDSARQLPSTVRELLTRRRAGTICIEAANRPGD